MIPPVLKGLGGDCQKALYVWLGIQRRPQVLRGRRIRWRRISSPGASKLVGIRVDMPLLRGLCQVHRCLELYRSIEYHPRLARLRHCIRQRP
jgi:hypothetical protein